jgi:uncharacterized protein involved in response to NO
LHPCEQKSEEGDYRGAETLPLYLGTGIAFLLLAGFLGGWSVVSVSPALAQVHGHLELFGFVGSLFLGFGFYSLRHCQQAQVWARASWVLWVAGAGLRCAAASNWHWRTLLPASAVLELSVALTFAAVVIGGRIRRGRPPRGEGRDLSAVLIMGANIGFVLTAVANAMAAFSSASRGQTPAFGASFDQRLTILYTWGFAAPLAWAIAAKWLPRLMALKPTRSRLLLAGCVLDLAGIVAALADKIHLAAVLLLHAAIFLPSSLRVFAKAEGESRIRSGAFVRLAFVWLRVAATLGVWASVNDAAHVWGSSRHSLLVGFVLMLVLAMADALRLVASPRLAMGSMLLLNVGCLVHVVSELLIHERLGAWARYMLAAGGGIELLAMAMFAINMGLAAGKQVWATEFALSPGD